MPRSPAASIRARLQHVADTRVGSIKRHRLPYIIAIALCGVLAGADTRVEIEQVRPRADRSVARTFLERPNGVPSHEAFGRVVAVLDLEQFEQGFRS
jgi:hypothetical protein